MPGRRKAEPSVRTFDRWVSFGLSILGSAFLMLALSKPLLLVLGARARGVILFQEGGVNTRGSYRVRYRFIAEGGRPYDGTAFTAVKDARFIRASIAYLPSYPSLNMPASGSYALVTGFGWALAGVCSLGIGRVLRHGRKRAGGPAS